MDETYIRAGTSDRVEGVKVRVKQTYVHKMYDSTNFDYDFALLKLEDQLKWSHTLDFIDLPLDEDVVGTGDICFTLGWGKIIFKLILSHFLKVKCCE